MQAVLAMLLCCGAARALAAPVLDEAMRKKAEAATASGALPGLVIGVIDGAESAVFSFGKADADTVFEIGSVTKTFTALLLADAVNAGKVTLDDPVGRLLPGDTVPAFGQQQITLKDLVTQYSGLPRLPENLLPKRSDNPYAEYGAAELKQFLAGYRLQRAPGSRYEYSNLGFGLLGTALARQAGTSYGELLAQRITAPLAMRDTGVQLTPAMRSRLAAGHGKGGKVVANWDMDALAGAGAVYSNAHDMLRYVRAHMQPAGAYALVQQPLRAMGTGKGAQIGMAWMIQTVNGSKVVWHNGMTGGYASFAGFTADGRRGVVVLANAARPLEEFGMNTLVPPPPAEARVAVQLAPSLLAEYEGRYQLTPHAVLTVRGISGGLEAQLSGQSPLPIYASAADQFFYRAVNAQLGFKRDAAGAIESVVLHQGGREIPAPRLAASASTAAVAATPAVKPVAVKLDAALLQDYVGTYDLGMGLICIVSVEDGQLHAHATGMARVPLQASARDEFFNEEFEARFNFKREGGAVSGVVVNSAGPVLGGARRAR